MIGQIEFDAGGRRQVVTLSDTLTWESDNKMIQQLLRRSCPPRRGATLDERVAGRHLLFQAAERLGGVVRSPRRDPGPTRAVSLA